MVLATAADADGTPVAGALNLRGSHALFGRNWGCSREVKHLHFELCYYQALDAAIQLKLPRVEAGAQVRPGTVCACNLALAWCAVPGALLTLLLGRQGEHKIQRGYGLRSLPLRSAFLRALHRSKAHAVRYETMLFCMEAHACCCQVHAGLPRYLPSMTYSSHYIRDPMLRGAVANFLRRERAQVEYNFETLTAYVSPYKDADA